MYGFYWLVSGTLAGCARPGLRWDGPRSFDDGDIDADLASLRAQGIGALLSLTETSLEVEAVGRSGLSSLHLPVPDFHAPSPDQLRASLAFIDRHRSEGIGVAIHCRAGMGRTGTVLAAYLIRGGAPPDEAIQIVREVCPHAVESKPQVEALKEFAKRRDWLV